MQNLTSSFTRLSQNVLLLYNSKKTYSQTTGSILHGNCHSTIGSYPDICCFVKLLIKESVFYEQLERDNCRFNLPNLFANGSVLLAKRVLLIKYIISFRDN